MLVNLQDLSDDPLDEVGRGVDGRIKGMAAIVSFDIRIHIQSIKPKRRAIFFGFDTAAVSS